MLIYKPSARNELNVNVHTLRMRFTQVYYFFAYYYMLRWFITYENLVLGYKLKNLGAN